MVMMKWGVPIEDVDGLEQEALAERSLLGGARRRLGRAHVKVAKRIRRFRLPHRTLCVQRVVERAVARAVVRVCFEGGKNVPCTNPGGA